MIFLNNLNRGMLNSEMLLKNIVTWGILNSKNIIFNFTKITQKYTNPWHDVILSVTFTYKRKYQAVWSSETGQTVCVFIHSNANIAQLKDGKKCILVVECLSYLLWLTNKYIQDWGKTVTWLIQAVSSFTIMFVSG